jgi:predicted nucleic acid-binding Zn ribbon protein
VTATTGSEQGETLTDAVARTRAAVADPRFPALADDALRTYGDDLRTNLGRADQGELFTPLEAWTGSQWDPGAAIVTQDRAVLAWGQSGRHQIQVIPRKRDPGGVTDIDIQPDATTLWIDCDQPLNVRIQRFQPGMDVPQTFGDKLRQSRSAAPAADELPPADHQCPHCFEPVRADADFCPACGRHIGKRAGRSKKPIIIALIVLLLLLIAGIVALALLRSDDEPAVTKPSPTATEAPTQAPPATIRRISGPGWAGQAPRSFKVARSGGGDLRTHVLTGPNGAVIRIFHTPREQANPGAFEVGKRKPLQANAESAELATVRNFGPAECASRTCSDLLLNDPAWGGIAITVNATSGSRLDAAKAIAASIKPR